MKEFDLLARVFASNGRLPDRVVLPPGDDMALIELDGARRMLVASDSVIEGRHTPRGIDPYVIGRKAVLRNLSDVAAMANARPLATVASVVLPGGISDERAWRLYEGLRDTAAAWDAWLVGGDIASVATSADAPIIASVTILAVPLDPDSAVASRGAARTGDGVFVTGTIGGAWHADSGLGRHLDFSPRIAQAQWLFRNLGPRLGAMIDVSDGLGRDLGHIAEQSRCTIRCELAKVPVPIGIAPREAIGQGEDYELAFTARGDVPSAIAGIPITRIGVVEEGPASVVFTVGSDSFDGSKFGFEHDGPENPRRRA
jgi:thiamine-monophosphate kinase